MKKLSAGLINLVAILNDGHYHDGTSIGEQLHITRSAVWKAIKKIQQYGIKIDCIKGKGYALLEPLILLNDKKIKQVLQSKVNLTIFESIDSTNTYLKRSDKSEHDFPKIHACLAEQQTQGKGRFQRVWHSPFAQNIYLSCLYPLRKEVSELGGLNLVVSLAIIKTLSAYGLQDTFLVKWPNDILYQDKKISGNLIEIQAESYGPCRVIIGIGMNVNMLEDDNIISQNWISLRKISAHYIDRNILAAELINHLFYYLEQFEKHGLKPFLAEWAEVDYLKNKEINLKNGDQQISGKVLGIDTNGHLKVKLRDSRVQHFSAGDTSVLK